MPDRGEGQLREHSPIRSLMVAGCVGTVIRIRDGGADVVWFGKSTGEGDEIEHVPLDEIEFDLEALGWPKPTTAAMLIKHTRELEVACRKLGIKAKAESAQASGDRRRHFRRGCSDAYTAIADRLAVVLKSLGLDR